MPSRSVDAALLWLWALAGDRRPPMPAQMAWVGAHPGGQIRLPGGDAAAFTAAALALLEALLFAGDTAALEVARAFLQGHADPLAQRALRLMDALIRQDTAGGVEVGIDCADCGAQDLELWYTGQAWGDTLCEPCYEARVAHGQARPPEL